MNIVTVRGGNRMLFTDGEILSRFKKRLEKSTRVRIVTAWATSGPQLDALEAAVQKKGLKVRAIVGTHGNATEPLALKLLHKRGKLRLAGNKVLFHPKVYVFECRNGASRAWVGSANFTQRGFGGGNVEIMYETDEVGYFEEWFREQWRHLEPATGEAIAAYRKRRKKNPPGQELRNLVGKRKGAVAKPSLLLEGQTWGPVLDPKEIRSAFDRMRETLIHGAKVFPDMKVRGARGVRGVYWHADPGYWCAFRDPDIPRKQYWNCFGLEQPRESDRVRNDFDLEINPPFDGNSNHAGLFVQNKHGDIFLARNLKRIPKVDWKGLEGKLNENERLSGRIVDVPWRRRTRRMIVLGEVGSGELRGTIAELVRLVVELKGTA